jgi:hypothetical protein
MYEEREILLDTFDAHTATNVDAADVLARVEAISRSRRRSRWVVQVTAVSLATVGLVAGGMELPGVLFDGAPHVHSTTVSAASDPSPDHTQAQELSAFFDAGYVYGDAQKLAALWHETNITSVKAEAGQKLLDGVPLPVQPSGDPVPAPDQNVEAFFNAGYDMDDAIALAGIWHTTDAYQAKIKGGKRIENGESLPIPPSGKPGGASASHGSKAPLSKLGTKKMLIIRKGAALAKAGAKTGSSSGTSEGLTPALAAYSNAGYDYTNAQQLASIWHETDLAQVKSQAGQKLLDGETLPVQPSEQPAPPTDAAVSTFFADGYDYNDAVQLSSIWNVSVYHAKVQGGQTLEHGGNLPIRP